VPEGEIPVDWLTVVMSLIHPTKVIILEAMSWTGRPTSATELEKMAGGDPILSAFSFHLKQLAKAEILEVVGKLKIKKTLNNKKETFFYFAGESQWTSELLLSGDLTDPLHKLALMLTTSRSGPAPVELETASVH
jgi:hypothetical protein